MNRDTGKLTGRHADPVDQADAILFTEDLRIRALTLVNTQDEILARGMQTGGYMSLIEAVRWMSQAYDVLQAVARA